MSKKRQPGMTNQGVRDLDDPGWRARLELQRKPATPWVPPESATQPTLIVDLIYCALESADKEGILALWPDTEFQQTYDYIHEHRTEVRVRCSYVEWYRFLVRSGLAEISLAFQLSMLEEQELIKVVLDLERPGWRERIAARGGKEAR
jgi:hypothetical protein